MNQTIYVEKPFIYLASPYSDDKDETMQYRADNAAIAAAYLIEVQGAVVFSPIVHSHPLVPYLDDAAATSFNYWKEFDEHMIELCDQLCVLTMPGWDVSVGVKHEIQHAKKLGIPIHFLSWMDVERWLKRTE